MSRAFVKEQEGDAIVEDLPERPQSPHPNYVTPAGLAKLEAQRGALIEQQIAGTLADLAQGRAAGRSFVNQITLFKSTGTALEDLAAAVFLYEQARG